MKKGFIIAFLFNMVLLTAYFQEDIVNFILQYIEEKPVSEQLVFNEYKLDFDYMYIENTINTTPQNYDELKKLYYSFINSGMKEITFYCDENYKDCQKDIEKLSNDPIYLGILNNYVHPYNSYEYIATDIHGNANTIYVSHKYNRNIISELNYKVDEIIDKYITSNMSDKEKIEIIHDYIINNVTYDKEIDENSNLAYGALIENKAICSGYTDAMSIFLYKFNIPNYRISTDEHIWNLVKVDGKWYHIDLTWDDPVNITLDKPSHEYFLLTTKELLSKNDNEHDFDKYFYPEI